MKKFLVILSSLLFFIALSSFNPKSFSFELDYFKIKEIEIENNSIIEEKKIYNYFFNNFYGTSLIFLNEKKINNIIFKNKLIETVQIKKLYPRTLKIKIFEKKPIAILIKKQKRFYLIKNGEEIEYFTNPNLESLPYIFGSQNNFLEVYKVLEELKFPIENIKSFYYFDIGRWDILLKNKNIIKLPEKDFLKSLENFIHLTENLDYEKYKIFDYRIPDQLILN